MVDKIRENLGKVTGELIESFIQFDRERVRKFQTGLHAIHSAQKGLPNDKRMNLHDIYDERKLTDLLNKYGISDEHFNKVPLILKEFEEGRADASQTMKELPELLQEAIYKVNQRNRDIYEIPASGMIAVSLNLIKNDVKNALIAGQAGERTLRTLERIPNHKNLVGLPMNKDAILKDRLYDFGSNTRLARPYLGKIGNEPDYLVAAKATQHLADLLEGLVMLEPDISEQENTIKAINAFRTLTRNTFITSSNKLKEHGQTGASEQISDLAKYLKQDFSISKKSIRKEVEKCLIDACANLKDANKLSQQEIDDFMSLLNLRLEQVDAIK